MSVWQEAQIFQSMAGYCAADAVRYMLQGDTVSAEWAATRHLQVMGEARDYAATGRDLIYLARRSA